MNRIEAVKARSKHCPDPHLVITVDGMPLDELLDAAGPDIQAAGLIPTLLGWMWSKDERALTWGRILPEVGSSAIAPILICPDDLDFNCSVVVVEVIAEQHIVHWNRLGYDASTVTGLECVIGGAVHWFAGVGPYHFERAEYEACLATFRVQCRL